MKSKLLTISDYISESKKNVFLFEKTWKENSTLLLHGSRDADKTARALDIAIKIVSEGRELVYVDTQDSLRDHEDKLASLQHLFILKPCFDDPADERDYADLVISAMEDIIKTTDIRVFIVDSITRIAGLSFGRNASASYIMKRLVALQMRYGVSLLVIAHNSTKATDRAISYLADSTMEIAEPQTLEDDATDVIAVTEPQQGRQSLSRKQRRAQKRLAKRTAQRQTPFA